MNSPLISSPEFKALCGLLGDDAQTIERISETEFDWEILCGLSYRHRLSSHLMKRLEPHNWVPEEVKQNLLAAHNHQKAKNRKLMIEIQLVTSVLGQIEVRPILLKGPPLASRLFNDSFLRHAGDLDWLVDQKDMPRIYQKFTSLGYIEATTNNSLTPEKWKYLRWVNHDLVFVHPHTKLMNEVHWNGFQLDAFFPNVMTEKMRSDATDVPFEGGMLRMLTLEDQLVYLANHGARHRWQSLHWLYDINKILASNELNFDRKLADKNIRRYDQVYCVDQGIELCNLFFGSNIPYFGKPVQPRLAWLREKAIEMIECPFEEVHNREKQNYLRTDIVYFYALRKDIRIFYQYLLMFWMDPSLWRTVTLPPSLTWMYVPLRPFLWVLKKWQSKIASRREV